MASEPEREPGDPGVSGLPIQRDVQAAGALPPSWLDEAEHQDQSDLLDRLAADYELVNDLALAGFKGRDWEYFSTELARYGFAVIRGWMRRSLIFARCKDRHIKGVPPPPERPFDDDEIVEIANETVALALVHFRDDVLMLQRWDHHKGATLRTYFIGQCLIRFAGVYRTWWTKERTFRDAVTDDDELLEDLGPHFGGTASRAIDRVIVQEALRTVKDSRVRTAMLLTADGWRQTEIAEHLGVTPHAVHRMLANERDRLERRKLG